MHAAVTGQTLEPRFGLVYIQRLQGSCDRQLLEDGAQIHLEPGQQGRGEDIALDYSLSFQFLVPPDTASFGKGYPHFAGAVFEILGELALDRLGRVGGRDYFHGNQRRALVIPVRIDSGPLLLLKRDNADVRLQPLAAAGSQTEPRLDEDQESALDGVSPQGLGDAVLDNGVPALGWWQFEQLSFQELALAGRIGQMLELLKGQQGGGSGCAHASSYLSGCWHVDSLTAHDASLREWFFHAEQIRGKGGADHARLFGNWRGLGAGVRPGRRAYRAACPPRGPHQCAGRRIDRRRSAVAGPGRRCDPRWRCGARGGAGPEGIRASGRGGGQRRVFGSRPAPRSDPGRLPPANGDQCIRGAADAACGTSSAPADTRPYRAHRQHVRDNVDSR